MMLSVQDLAIQFGGLKAVDGISFDIEPGKFSPYWAQWGGQDNGL